MLAICEKVSMNFNRDKLDETLVHIARRSQADTHFDETKLLLLLAFADFLAFGRSGKPITGAVYVKLAFGPAAQEAVSETASFIGVDRDVLPGVLSDGELGIVEEVVERYRAWTSVALSDEAKREFTGWRMADEGEHISYGTVFLAADQTPSPEAIEYGQKMAAELGLVAL